MAHPSDVFSSQTKHGRKGEAMYNKWIFPDNWQVLVVALCSILHQRSAWRLNIVIAGIVFTKGRKTVTSWFRTAGISRQYKAFTQTANLMRCALYT